SERILRMKSSQASPMSRPRRKISWEAKRRLQIKTNTYEAKVRKINRRLATLSMATGIPLHRVRTRREHYLGTGNNPIYLRNEETGETVMEASIDSFDFGTSCMVERKRKIFKGCDVISKILATYNLKLVAAKEATWRGKLRVNAISFERLTA